MSMDSDNIVMGTVSPTPADPTSPLDNIEEFQKQIEFFKDLSYNEEEHGYDTDDDSGEESHETVESKVIPAQKGQVKKAIDIAPTFFFNPDGSRRRQSMYPGDNISPSQIVATAPGEMVVEDVEDVGLSYLSVDDENSFFEIEAPDSPAYVATGQDVATQSLMDLNKKRKQKIPRHMKTKHRKINREHPEFELTYDMMLGIRTTVSLVEAKPHHAITQQDLKSELKLAFPGYGSSITPAHEARDFKFKDYMPEVFRHIRARFDIDPAEYLLCVCGNFEFLEFISNSKSGQFFFYTHDRRYMIKTITQEESKFLRRILPAYYDHIMKYPNTLVSRFLGMHRVKPHKKKEQHFLIMGSVFNTTKQIQTVYDLKGSTQGRAVTAKEKLSSSCVYKDLDFLEHKKKIKLGPYKEEFMAQLERDVKFLEDLEIMDYSLLLGIHDRSTKPEFYEADVDVDADADADADADIDEEYVTEYSTGDIVAVDIHPSSGSVAESPVVKKAAISMESSPSAQSMSSSPQALQDANRSTETDLKNERTSGESSPDLTAYAVGVEGVGEAREVRSASVVERKTKRGTKMTQSGDSFNHGASMSFEERKEKDDEFPVEEREKEKMKANNFLPRKYNKCATPQQHQVSFKPTPTSDELRRVTKDENLIHNATNSSSVLPPSNLARMRSLSEDGKTKYNQGTATGVGASGANAGAGRARRRESMNMHVVHGTILKDQGKNKEQLELTIFSATLSNEASEPTVKSSTQDQSTEPNNKPSKRSLSVSSVDHVVKSKSTEKSTEKSTDKPTDKPSDKPSDKVDATESKTTNTINITNAKESESKKTTVTLSEPVKDKDTTKDTKDSTKDSAKNKDNDKDPAASSTTFEFNSSGLITNSNSNAISVDITSSTPQTTPQPTNTNTNASGRRFSLSLPTHTQGFKYAIPPYAPDNVEPDNINLEHLKMDNLLPAQVKFVNYLKKLKISSINFNEYFINPKGKLQQRKTPFTGPYVQYFKQLPELVFDTNRFRFRYVYGKNIIGETRPGLDFAASHSVFMNEDGGINGRDANGEVNDYIYYAGVIDILTVYNWKKKGEHFFKTFKFKEDEISAVHPTKYADRFLDFIREALE